MVVPVQLAMVIRRIGVGGGVFPGSVVRDIDTPARLAHRFSSGGLGYDEQCESGYSTTYTPQSRSTFG